MLILLKIDVVAKIFDLIPWNFYKKKSELKYFLNLFSELLLHFYRVFHAFWPIKNRHNFSSSKANPIL